MKYLADTNVWVSYLRRRGSTSLSAKVTAVHPSEIVICTVVRAELLTGAHKSSDPRGELNRVQKLISMFPSLSFDEKAADRYGEIRSQLEKQGTPIGANDLMIAAIAVANDLILVTHNTQEFRRVVGLRLEDWQ